MHIYMYVCMLYTLIIILVSKVISAGMSSKILKEALIQQKEIQAETDAENPNNIVFPEEPVTQTQVDDDDDDVDNFAGFSDNHSQFGGYEVCLHNFLHKLGLIA